MDYSYLEIQIPRLSDEQAAGFQQVFYAFMEAFDTQYCYAIERYYRSFSEQQNERQKNELQILKELLSKEEDPF
jgi:pyrroloquinoline quinone (PQQ) biosynthesis protein C